MQQTAILGFGNPCRSDDAVGIYVIELLQHKIGSSNENVALFDMGTAAFEILFKLKGFEKLILVDAVINSGQEVGSIFKLPAETILKAPVDDPLVFLHSLKWDQALSYAKKILGNEYPKNIEVYLIAIDDTSLEIQLSETVKRAGIKVSEKITADLEITSLEVI